MLMLLYSCFAQTDLVNLKVTLGIDLYFFIRCPHDGFDSMVDIQMGEKMFNKIILRALTQNATF